ncbi:MAG: hypothetical protein IT553_01595 [Sphingomonadaceae bacterium]|nr:hypothetical protein [Sphingomonadaceae bacterium]
MAKERRQKPVLTDEERHRRFIEAAHEIEASEDPKAFDKAFKRVTSKPPEHSN